MSGADASTLQAREAGVASTLPAASIARTSKLWEPLRDPDRPWRAHAPPKLEPNRAGTRTIEPDSEEANETLAESPSSCPTGPPRSTCPAPTHPHSRPARPGSRRHCRRRRSPARRSCGSHRQARCRPSASCKPPKPSRRAGTQTTSRTQKKQTKRSPQSKTSCPTGPPKSTCPARWCHRVRSRSRRVTRRSRRRYRPRLWRGRRTCASPRPGRRRPSASCRIRRQPRRCGTQRSKPLRSRRS